MHSEENIEGKLFIAFIALVIKMEINRLVYRTKDPENRTVQEVIDEMKLLRCTFIESRTKPLITEQTKLQKLVMKTLGVKGEFDLDAPAADDSDPVRNHAYVIMSPRPSDTLNSRVVVLQVQSEFEYLNQFYKLYK